MSVGARMAAALAASATPRRAALVACLISLPALAFGPMADDHILALQVREGVSPFALFDASAERLATWRQHGALAWWSSPRLAVHFFRPLASLWHSLEFRVFPGAHWLMLLENVLLYGAACWLAARLYQRVATSTRVAAWASILFVIDEAHAMSVGWVSGRNTVLALLFSLAALYFQDTGAERPSRSWLSAVCVALALLSAEAGVWSVLLLAAHTLTRASGSLRARITRVAPQLAVAALWAGVYVHGRFGVRGTSFYRELTSPLGASIEGVLDLPLTLGSLFGPSICGFGLVLPVSIARLAALPVAALAAWLVWPGLRRDAATRFFALASALCLLPAFLTIAQDRVLMGASFGAFGLIAQGLDAVWGQASRGARVRRALLVALHGVLALLMYPLNLVSVRRFENGTRALSAASPAHHDVVLVNAPVELLTDYVLALRTYARGPAPPHTLHQLYAGGADVTLTRVDAHTLEVHVPAGWARVPFERIFGAERDLPSAGSVIGLERLSVHVVESSPDGRPTRVRFVFPSSLEAPGRTWLVWQGTRPVPFTPPGLGERAQLAAISPLEALPL